MKRQFKNGLPPWFIFLSGLLVSLVLISCSREVKPGGPIVVQVEWLTSPGHYQPTPFHFHDLSDLQHVSGSIANTVVHPSFSSNSKSLTGTQFIGRFVQDTDGVYIPIGESLMATTIYANLERLYDMDRKLGVANLGQWPEHVALDARLIHVPPEEAVNDAFYLGQANALLLVPYVSHRLPFAMNAGIMGHEHFHALFQYLVLNRGVEKIVARFEHQTSLVNPATYNNYYLRAINEGLADVWGWVYSGDPEFLNASDDSGHLRARALNGALEPLASDAIINSEIRTSILRKDPSMALSYQMGTSVSRLMFHIYANLDMGPLEGTPDVGLKSRLKFARYVLKALPALRQEIRSDYATRIMTLNSLVKPILDVLPETAKTCQIINAARAELPGACPATVAKK